MSDGDEACSFNYTALDNSTTHGIVTDVFGGVLALVSGALLALSISVQRYALAHPSPKAMPLLCFRMPRPAVWTVGLVIYILANCLFAYSSTLAPLTLGGTMYTLLLVWNLAFASLLLKERVSRRNALGALFIVIGSIISVFGTPTQAPDDYGVNDITYLAREPAGIAYLCVQLGAGLITALVVLSFEVSLARRKAAADERDPNAIRVLLEPALEPHGSTDRFMAFMYPVSQGLMEGVTQLTVKAITAMGFDCLDKQFPPCCIDSPTLWITVALFSGVGVLTVIWLKLVYARYSVSLAMPIQYGTLQVGAILGGVVFYREFEYMDWWQYVLTFVGLAAIVGGIALGDVAQPQGDLEAKEAAPPASPTAGGSLGAGEPGPPP